MFSLITQRFRNAFYYQRSRITVTRYFNIWWWTILGCIISLTGLVVVIYGFSGICSKTPAKTCEATLGEDGSTERTCAYSEESFMCSAQFFLGILCCLLGIHVISVFSYCWMSRGHDIMHFAPIVNRLRDSDRHLSREARNELVRKEKKCNKMRIEEFDIAIRKWKLPSEVESIIRSFTFHGVRNAVEGGSCFKRCNKAMVYIQIVGLLVVAQIAFGVLLHYLLFNFTANILIPAKSLMKSSWKSIMGELFGM